MVTKLVNFFGHAAVAVWMAGTADPDPHVVFGAMLPDFASMIRGRVREVRDPAVARGVALHHATDAAFHHLAPVVAHMRELDDALARHGCARAPRLATAHVGFELLLDGALVADSAAREAYNRAVACEAWRELTWRDDAEHARLGQLVARLRAYGPPDDLRDPHAITLRLARILAPRPRLAASAADLEAIERALTEHAPRATAAAETITRALRAALAAPAATRDADDDGSPRVSSPLSRP
jgi:hypothetical protein